MAAGNNGLCPGFNRAVSAHTRQLGARLVMSLARLQWAVTLIAFLKARLSPEGYLGLHLTPGAFLLIGATWLVFHRARPRLGNPILIFRVTAFPVDTP